MYIESFLNSQMKESIFCFFVNETTKSSENEEWPLRIVECQQMMYIMAYILLTIVVPLVSQLFEDVEPIYVPRRLCWNKTYAVFSSLWICICTLDNMVVDYIICIKVDYKYRWKQGRAGYHRGRQLYPRVNEAVAMAAQDPQLPRPYLNQFKFDTDSRS